MIAADTDLDALFKRLHLANARRVWRGLIDRAERERWAYRDFLTLLATEEIAHRQKAGWPEGRIARLVRGTVAAIRPSGHSAINLRASSSSDATVAHGTNASA